MTVDGFLHGVGGVDTPDRWPTGLDGVTWTFRETKWHSSLA